MKLWLLFLLSVILLLILLRAVLCWWAYEISHIALCHGFHWACDFVSDVAMRWFICDL